jgi:hypothetical protein
LRFYAFLSGDSFFRVIYRDLSYPRLILAVLPEISRAARLIKLWARLDNPKVEPMSV